MMAAQFDEHVLPRLSAAIERLALVSETSYGSAAEVFTDLRDRVRALRCWSMTQRNTCAWVAGVYGYLCREDRSERTDLRTYLDRMIDLASTRELLDLWEHSETEFMLVSNVGETSYIYGENFGDHLRTKLRLTEQYRDCDPRTDRNILWRV